MVICGIIVTEVIIVRITTSKSKNSESFYITQSYTNANGKSTSKTIRKLGTLAELSAQLHTDRDGVVEGANEQARLETLKYKSRHKFEYDLNTILSDLIYTRVLEPSRKRSSFRATKQFLEPPTYQKKSKRRSNITIFRVCRKKCYTPCIYKDCGTFLTNQLSKMRVYRWNTEVSRINGYTKNPWIIAKRAYEKSTIRFYKSYSGSFNLFHPLEYPPSSINIYLKLLSQIVKFYLKINVPLDCTSFIKFVLMFLLRIKLASHRSVPLS